MKLTAFDQRERNPNLMAGLPVWQLQNQNRRPLSKAN